MGQSLVVFKNEGLDGGVHHVAPAAAGEDAVVARTFDFQVFLQRFGNVVAKAVRRFGLARA